MQVILKVNLYTHIMERSFDYFSEKYHHSRALDTALREGIISQEDADLITQYVHTWTAVKDVSLPRINNFVSSLIQFRRFMRVTYQEATIADVHKGMAALRKGKTTRKAFPTQDPKPPSSLSQNTIYNRITNVKPFLFWMIDKGYFSIPPRPGREKKELIEETRKEIAAIKPPRQNRDTVKGEDLYTWDEIQALIDNCTNSRDRALIITMYETGARIGELAALTWGDLSFDKYGVKVRILNKKMEKVSERKYRQSRLTLATEHLSAWRQDSSDTSPGALVFVNLHTHEPITRVTVKRLLEKLQKKTGIQKKIRAHMFRHTRATHMIRQNFQESVIKKSLWGNLDTPMFSVYVNLTDNDIDEEFLRKAGIEVEEDASGIPKPITCANCHTINQPGNEYCFKCGMGLTPAAIADEDQVLETVRAQPEIQKQQEQLDAMRQEIKELKKMLKKRG